MSSLRFLSVQGGSVLLLLLLLLLTLTAVCESYYGDSTTPSEYDFDSNATFEYSFFSNSSADELDKFIGGMTEVDYDEGEEVEEEVSFTTAATPRKTTERSKKERGGSRGGGLGSSASLPVCLVLAGLLNHLKRGGSGPFDIGGG